MKKFLKRLFITGAALALFCMSIVAQNNNIEDHSGFIRFQADGAYKVSNIAKSAIVNIATISSTEVRIITTDGVSGGFTTSVNNQEGARQTFAKYGNVFDLDYTRWTIANVSYGSVLLFEQALKEIAGVNTKVNQIGIAGELFSKEVPFYGIIKNDTVTFSLVDKVASLSMYTLDSVKVVALNNTTLADGTVFAGGTIPTGQIVNLTSGYSYLDSLRLILFTNGAIFIGLKNE